MTQISREGLMAAPDGVMYVDVQSSGYRILIKEKTMPGNEKDSYVGDWFYTDALDNEPSRDGCFAEDGEYYILDSSDLKTLLYNAIAANDALSSWKWGSL